VVQASHSLHRCAAAHSGCLGILHLVQLSEGAAEGQSGRSTFQHQEFPSTFQYQYLHAAEHQWRRGCCPVLHAGAEFSVYARAGGDSANGRQLLPRGQGVRGRQARRGRLSSPPLAVAVAVATPRLAVTAAVCSGTVCAPHAHGPILCTPQARFAQQAGAVALILTNTAAGACSAGAAGAPKGLSAAALWRPCNLRAIKGNTCQQPCSPGALASV
jgi:hypothetical protein